MENRHENSIFQSRLLTDYLFNKFNGMPICLDLYLNRHHTTEHRQRDGRVALDSNFKGQIHSQQNLFAKCLTESFAPNQFLGVKTSIAIWINMTIKLKKHMISHFRWIEMSAARFKTRSCAATAVTGVWGNQYILSFWKWNLLGKEYSFSTSPPAIFATYFKCEPVDRQTANALYKSKELSN